MVLPLVIAGASAGAAVGGALLKDRAARKAAKAKQAALERWQAERTALAKALSQNYVDQGMDQMRGTTSFLQSLGDGQDYELAKAGIPDAVVTTPEAAAELDPAFRAAYARRAGTEAGVANAGLAADVAASRRAKFLQTLDRKANVSTAATRWNDPTYSRARFLNAMAANDADARFQRAYGDIPNSARNMDLLGSLLQIGGQTGMTAAGRMG